MSIDICKEVCPCNQCNTEQEECELAKAYEKQIPKKPNNIKAIIFDGAINAKFKSGECSSCGGYIDTDDDYYYCHNKDCGQAIDWSETTTDDN